MRLEQTEIIARQGIFGTLTEEFPFPFLPGYAKALSRVGGSVIYFQDDTLEACAPLHLFRNRVLRLGRWLSPPMRAGQLLGVVEEAAFILSVNRYLMAHNLCDRLLQPPNQALFQSVPPGSRYCKFGAYTLSLGTRSDDEIFQNFHPHYRRDIRRAMRDGALIRFGIDNLPVFHQMHDETMTRAGLPAATLIDLEHLAGALGPDHTLCVVAYDPNGQAQGGLFGAVTQHSFCYLYGASVAKPSIPGAIKLAHWEVMRECLRRQVRCYDFVGARLSDVSGTKLEHIQMFKSRFGSKLREGFLWKQDLRPGRTAIYEAANSLRKTIRWLKNGKIKVFQDIIDQENCRATKP